MKKLEFLVLAMMVAGLFVGCASNKIVKFGDSKVPEWYKENPEPDDGYIYASSARKIENHDIETAMLLATADARGKLSEMISIDTDVETTTTNSSKKKSQTFERKVNQKSVNILEGSAPYKSEIIGNIVYVLVRVPE